MKIFRHGAALAVGAALLATISPLHAEPASPGRDAAVVAVQPTAEATRRAAARELIREALSERMVREVDPAVVAADAKRIADTLDEHRLAALLASGDAAPVLGGTRAVLSIATVTSTDRREVLAAPAVGDARADLVFVPVAPCRIIDTRLPGALGGVLGPGQTRSFRVTGDTQFSHQGGNGGGCKIPIGAAEPAAPAVVINFVAVGPQGPGHLEAWAFGQPVPNASVINYSNVSGLNIANGVIVPITGTGTSPSDLNIRANVSGTHVVADVTGYFTRFPTEQLTTSSKQVFVAGDGGQVDLSDGTCKLLNSCTVTSTVSGQVIVRTQAQVSLAHTQGTETHDRVTIGPTFGSIGNPPNCTPIVDQVANMDFEIPDVGPTDPDVDVTLSFARVFQQPATTRTYSLLGTMVVGAGTGDKVESSRIICWFIPDA